MVVRVSRRNLLDPRLDKGFTNNSSRSFSFKECKELFKELWMLGWSYSQIMDTLGIKHVLTVRAWRKRLKLPPRKPGGYTRDKQVAYMKEQIK